MTNPFLIAHKVRGQPAFDVAIQMRCPHCQGVGGYMVPDFETDKVTDYEGSSCIECDSLGYWWIIPTSGHRAYPYVHQIIGSGFNEINISCEFEDIPMPPSLPDHYHLSTPRPTTSLIDALGLRKPKAGPTPVARRF